MTLQEVIKQLEDIKDHCESMRDENDPDDIWTYDVQALDVAISELKLKESELK